MRNKEYNKCIETSTGRLFWPLDPVPGDVDILDIAHALSNKCRFTGHTKRFYSIAQHSVLVSQFVPEEFMLEGLLHDAVEAYLPDLPFPLRGAFSEWESIENRVHEAVAERFGLRFPYPDAVVDVDRKIIRDEAWSFMKSQGVGKQWAGSTAKFGLRIRPWSPEESRERFVEQYQKVIESGRTIEDPWSFKSIIREHRKHG